MGGIPQIAVNVRAYMFDATDHLVPVPDEMRQDRGYGLQLMPYRIESQKGELLSRVQFVPWLGGAAIRVYGDLPLVPLVLLLGQMDPPPQQMKTPDGTISSILPIGRPQFELMLARFNRQSNVIIKREQPSWTVTKMADEGTSSPFMARLFLNILDFRRSALETKADIEAFEKPYELVLMSSITVRDLAREIGELLADHRSKIEQGVGVRIAGRTVHVDEPIDKELRRLVESFLNSSNRVMITGMKEVAKALHLDIVFFFKKESTFLNGVATLDGSDRTSPPIAGKQEHGQTCSTRCVTRWNITSGRCRGFSTRSSEDVLLCLSQRSWNGRSPISQGSLQTGCFVSSKKSASMAYSVVCPKTYRSLKFHWHKGRWNVPNALGSVQREAACPCGGSSITILRSMKLRTRSDLSDSPSRQVFRPRGVHKNCDHLTARNGLSTVSAMGGRL